MHKKVLLLLSFLLISLTINAQEPQKLTSNQIYEKVQKLNFLGSALYIAAHPDDENTRLIAYLSNHEKARTGYLSLTRGDGGQNLIGPEMRELLGVIRTQELLAARGVDGGEQRFSRANDFGYSKHPDETLKIWNKDKVLADVVWAIRTFKPDVVINRFNHRTPGTTHGHHTSSAMLSVEAFDLANNKTKYPEQLKYTDTWKPNRLFFNTSWWFYGSQEKFAKADKSKMLSFDIGTYYPLKGLSNNELASMASSQHLCQGFGRLTTRGTQTEYVEFLKGDFPKDKKDIFSGINTTWNRVEGGGEIGDILYEVEQNFDFVNPSTHLPALLQAYQKVQKLKDEHWKKIKTKELKEIIEACAGLYLEASAESSSAAPNSTINIDFEVLNRSGVSMELSSIKVLPENKKIKKDLDLANNKKKTFTETILIPEVVYSSPYWLQKPWDLGMYTVENQELRGKPETPRPIQVQFNLMIENQSISFVKPVVYRYSKRDKGEIYEPFEVLPKVTTKLLNKVLIFSSESPQKVTVEVRSGAKNTNGTVALKAPKGWSVMPSEAKFSIAQKGDIQLIDFMVTPTQKESEGVLKATAKVEGKNYDKELIEINYSHIPKQSVLLTSQAKVVRLNIQKNGTRIGYIQGSGDAIPESLQQIGYEVTELNVNTINGNLEEFDAVVVGIRAYNIIKELQFKQKYLLEYVKNGGNVIVQYNTNRGVDVQAPYNLQLSRDRVTNENAKVILLAKEHSILNYPNKITEADFEGWVQERGLYFPNKWSAEYTPILSMHDKGESAKKGSLLVAKYGKGNYIYTGLSFFRELPAGVPGAYKLFANLLSVKENTISEN
ncbi:LmbE family N-acetylglucosaminyl deacetylase [Tenacibaculum gallaicum]|uniref:LmbE family N-acetylglucosaminyl deacetylase n=1 Tax=Tenacibaculum gallaicum TaxID=561505 RepID=A0A3E0HMH7_9FLAO|nr:PIG-L family deacetylase [Tenacibaculum gallaicum]REH47426.1 LmbE family N-acetylglucosaminyl deacetylase [Tenacibaculum gallaicum]